MATTRKKGSDGALAAAPVRRKSRPRKATAARTGKRKNKPALSADTEALFAPTIDSSVLDVAPTPQFLDVHEVDIVEEAAAPPVVSLVPVSQLPPPPPRPRLSRVAIVAAILTLSTGVVGFQLGLRRARPNAPVASAVAAPVATPPAPTRSERERELGHAAFSAGRALEAIRHYDRALQLDRGVLDRRIVDNLVACYGLRQTQPLAATVIVRYQLADARPALRALSRQGRTHGTRAGARYTLEKLHDDEPARLAPT